MSRQVSIAVQIGDSKSVLANYFLEDFTCPVTQSLFFDPVMGRRKTLVVGGRDFICGHTFEKKECDGKLQKCPCCEEDITLFAPALKIKNILDQILINQPKLWKNVYFNLDDFAKILAQGNILKTETGLRYLRLLENAPNHLNNKSIKGTHSGKSAIEILVSTPAGRDLLQKKLKIESASGKYFFGNAEISAESLRIQVNGESIQKWLNIEVALDQEQKARKTIDTEFYRIRLFLLGGAAVNQILKWAVCGSQTGVKSLLDTIKTNPTTQLSDVLSNIGTAKDYSGRIISGMTLLQVSAAAGDIEMCLMLKNYLSPEEFATQLAKIFPKGIEAHEIEQQRNTFNFDAILAAIRAASTSDLDSAKLNKQDDNSALFHALEKFRDQFREMSHREKIFNPHHLLRAFEMYNVLWTECERDGSDRDYKKRDLFLCQIVGYIQRFVPACYAQAFAQGLDHLVKVDQPDSWRPEAFERDLTLRVNRFYYFPLPRDPRSGLGFNCAIFDVIGEAMTGGRDWSPLYLRFFQNFCRAKTASLQNMMLPVRMQSHNHNRMNVGA